MTPKLSIILPVYNVELYFERCIKSITSQDLAPHLYEIIVVDDGSPDKSIVIANKYAKQYSNIVIISQENTGLGGARNTGVKHAKGEYIWFIDSDDFIEKKVLQLIYNKIIKTKPDALAFDFKCTNVKGEIIDWIDFKLNFKGKQQLTGSEFYFLNYNDSYIWLYVFKRELFIKHSIFFKKRINMQDSEILPRLMYHVKAINFLDYPVYFYVNREDSFINSSNIKTRKKYYESIIKVYIHLLTFKEKLEPTSLIRIALIKKLKNIHKMIFLQYIYNDFEKSVLKELLIQLKGAKLYPFKTFEESNSITKKITYNILRLTLNIHPIIFRNLYLKLNYIFRK